MGWAFWLLNIGVVLSACRVRYAEAGLEYAVPIPIARAGWWLIATVLALAAAAGTAARKALSRGGARRAVMELLAIFPPFFAFEWLVLPPENWRVIDWSIMAAFALTAAALCWLDRRGASQWGLTHRNFLPAVRLLAIPTALMVAIPVAGAMVVGTDFQPRRALAALLAYPFYALAQLLVFQVFLVQRLRRITGSSLQVVAVSAGVFSLVHWPNGLMMCACFAAGCVWTAVYLRRPNVYALALSMGLAATALSSALPRQLTHNLRTGPIYVQRALDAGEAKAKAPPGR